MIATGGLLAALSTIPAFRLNSDSESFNIFGFSLIVILFGTGLVWALGMRAGFWRNLLASKPLRAMGPISYTFYLYQVAVMDKLAERIHPHLLVVILGFAITALLSAVSWRFFETRMLKIMLHYGLRSTPAGVS